MKESYRIILADDHRMIRQGIQRVIEEKAGLKVIAGVDDGSELLRSVQELRPDMVIVDLSMPKLDGIEATRQIKAKCPSVKVLVLTMYKDMDYLQRSLSAGADGYLVKEDADIELYKAVATIRKGENYISPALSSDAGDFSTSANQEPTHGPPDQELTGRQIEILKLIAQGKSSREIAESLFISVRTVGNHRTNIMKTLGMRKNIDLVRFAIRKGYVPVVDE